MRPALKPMQDLIHCRLEQPRTGHEVYGELHQRYANEAQKPNEQQRVLDIHRGALRSEHEVDAHTVRGQSHDCKDRQVDQDLTPPANQEPDRVECRLLAAALPERH